MSSLETVDKVRTVDDLRPLPGWNRLSEKQQQVIEASFYVQSRAQRDSGPEENPYFKRRETAHGSVTRFFTATYLESHGADPSNRAFGASQEHMATKYCHYAVHVLETGAVSDDPEFYPGIDYFIANYCPFESYDQLVDGVKDSTFPIVVLVGRSNPDFGGLGGLHSFVVFGKGEDGEYLVWEKRDLGQQYQVTTLRHEFERFNDFYSNIEWGIRPLKGIKEENSAEEV